MEHIKKILIPAAIVGGVAIVFAKLCKKESSDQIDLTLNDEDINEVEKEVVKAEKVRHPHKVSETNKKKSWGTDEEGIWDFGDL